MSQNVGALHIVVKDNNVWEKLHISKILNDDELESLGMNTLPEDTNEVCDDGDHLFFGHYGVKYILEKLVNILGRDCIIILTSTNLNTDENLDYACYFGGAIKYDYLNYNNWRGLPKEYKNTDYYDMFDALLPNSDVLTWCKKARIKLTKKEKETIKQLIQ